MMMTPHGGSGEELALTIPLRGDDWLFGVQACNGDYCSPVSTAVPGGAFEPVARSEGDSD